VKHDGINGLLHIGKHEPQVVLLDVNMPGTERPRSRPENPHEPRVVEDARLIVFITVHRDFNPIIVTRETGASEFLRKARHASRTSRRRDAHAEREAPEPDLRANRGEVRFSAGTSTRGLRRPS
jgi:PleD family two-component response regulator